MRSRFYLPALVAVCVLLFGAAGAGAQGAGDPAEVVEEITGDRLAEVMRAEGYAVEVDEDGDVVWKLEGFRTLLLISEDKTAVQFHIAFSDGNATLKKVNDWNKTKRFSRTYLDDEGDPHLELDLDMAGGVTVARVKDFLRTCKTSFDTWHDEVVE